MQDESNLRRPPKLKRLLRRNICYQFYTLNTQSMSNSIHFYQSVVLLHSKCLQSSSHSLLIFPNLFTVIPQHITIIPIHCTVCTTLLKTLHTHFWWDALPRCYDPHWMNNTLLFLGSQTYLYLWWRFIIFCTVGACGIKNFKYMSSGFLCCVYGLISLSSWFFLWLLICGLVQVLFLGL